MLAVVIFQTNAVVIAFARPAKFHNALTANDGECGHLYQHIKMAEETYCTLEAEDLTSIRDKFVLILQTCRFVGNYQTSLAETGFMLLMFR